MQLKPSRRSSLFLLELIISILFFSLAAAICVRFFVKSSTLETESIELDRAVTASTSVAEILRNDGDYKTQLQTIYPSAKWDNNKFVIFYDKEWNPCRAKDAVYSLCLETAQSREMLTGTIQVSDLDSSIYTLTIKKHLGKKEVRS